MLGRMPPTSENHICDMPSEPKIVNLEDLVPQLVVLTRTHGKRV